MGITYWLLRWAMCFLLAGCVFIPERLGINDFEWKEYSNKHKQRLIVGFFKGVNEHARLSKYSKNKKNNQEFLIVSIHGGKVAFPPTFVNSEEYQPIKFIILKDQYLAIEIKSTYSYNVKTILWACYTNNVLYLDPKRYEFMRARGTLNIPYSPLWLDGFSYKFLDSDGYVRFGNVIVDIEIKSKNKGKLNESTV
ncbi:MAG: hypothetical protein LBL40_01005 [Coxiellaceae bacterium]|jgi:hypothetical protein|nr:hypothetical protein [Coxiellaceae bacterium]